jgi:hypothetical protein
MFYYLVDVYTRRHRNEHSYTSVASAAAAAALIQDELHDAPEKLSERKHYRVCQHGNFPASSLGTKKEIICSYLVRTNMKLVGFFLSDGVNRRLIFLLAAPSLVPLAIPCTDTILHQSCQR